MSKSIKYLVSTALLQSILLFGGAPVMAGEEVTVYKSPTCGCCKKWISHLKDNGFKVNAYDVQDVAPIKQRSGISPSQASCHTALVGGYVVEGHVPANDIKRMLKEKPDIKGLTVPGMPIGSPGMEQGSRKDPYKVMTINKSGSSKVYAEY